MNTEEFAFFNQQLAAMLRDGIPLEGAISRLCADMRQSPLRNEFEAFGKELAQGIPIRDAVAKCRFPDLYKCLLLVGAQGNDLPAVLTMIADYYQQRYTIWTRLKGLMVYPLIVLAGTFTLSLLLAYVLEQVVWPNLSVFNAQPPPYLKFSLWLSPVLLGIVLVAAILLLLMPELRRSLRFRVSSFRESSLAQIAAALALLLRNNVGLDAALSLVERMESGTKAGEELSLWRRRLAEGKVKFSEMALPGPVFPPLFIWLVAHGREDLAGGFQRAAEIYQARANHRADILLYSALPCSVLALGFLIVLQIQPVFLSLSQVMNALGGE